MNITLNGKARHLDNIPTVAALLDSLRLDENRVAVEHNHIVLLKERFAVTALRDGDILEIVQFVGGG
jgi:sulfur carrier protein